MRELGLFEQYLEKLRREKLQQSHATLVGDLNDETLRYARTIAFEADLCNKLIVALRSLANDPGQFIQEFLK